MCQVALHEAGVAVLGGERAVKQMGLDAAPAAKHEYGNLSLTLELVSSMDEAINHIHTYGSSHTEAIITGVQRVATCLCIRTDHPYRHSNCYQRVPTLTAIG